VAVTAGPRLYRPDRSPSALRAALLGGEVPVAVHGLGRIGLPLAAVLAERTGAVTGVDVDPAVVRAVREGRSPVAEPGLADLVERLVDRAALRATTDPGTVDARLHVLVVPTPLTDDRRADRSAVLSAARAVGRGLSPGDLVVVESSVPPGTCTETVEPALVAASGLEADEFGLAHCPERTAGGRALRDVRGTHPRVVGGVDPESTRAAALVYDTLVDAPVHEAPDARTAACTKLFEGVYRDVNIALANELARAATDLGVDVPAAIDLANTQPYCDLHDPGPGVGGHCIPYYPWFLAEAVDRPLRLVETARTVNDGMPAHAAGVLVEALAARGVAPADARVALLGLTYRAGVAGTAESPARDLAGLLSVLGAEVVGLDPLLEDAAGFDLEFLPFERFEAVAPDLDAAVVVSPHQSIRQFDWSRLDPLLVVDGRDALELAGSHHDVVTLGDGTRSSAGAGAGSPLREAGPADGGDARADEAGGADGDAPGADPPRVGPDGGRETDGEDDGDDEVLAGDGGGE
jgi:UDP-N-acetyl-D-mannosaminuronic acid dehydrogenase